MQGQLSNASPTLRPWVLLLVGLRRALLYLLALASEVLRQGDVATTVMRCPKQASGTRTPECDGAPPGGAPATLAQNGRRSDGHAAKRSAPIAGARSHPTAAIVTEPTPTLPILPSMADGLSWPRIPSLIKTFSTCRPGGYCNIITQQGPVLVLHILGDM